MTDLTTDKVVINRSDMCLKGPDGLVHYSVMVEHFHPFVQDLGSPPPFLVLMCDMLDSYDNATSWRDLEYPMQRYPTDAEYADYPTCVRCQVA